MRAVDIMSHPVLAIDPDAPLLQAIRLMTQNRVSGLPVVDKEGRVVGMLTEGDLLRRVETGTEPSRPGWLTSFLFPGREADRYVQSHARRVNELMTSDVVGVAEDAPLRDVVGLMLKNHIKRVPVMRDGKLLGIVSRADLVARVGESLMETEPATSDEVIKQSILSAMAKETWSPRVSVSLSVTDGVVELDGCVFDIRVRDAIGVVAETAPGVKSVLNRVVCIEPYTGMITFDPENSA